MQKAANHLNFITLFILSWGFLLLIPGCASTAKMTTEEKQAEYKSEETKNQVNSQKRADVMAQIQALERKISAVRMQLDNQESLIQEYQDSKDEVASSKMMIDNAKVRIKHLNQDLQELTREKNSLQNDLSKLNGTE